MPNSFRPRVLFIESLSTVSGGQKALLDGLPLLSREFACTTVLPGPGELADALRACDVSPIYIPMGSYTLVSKGWRDLLTFAVETPRLIVTFLQYLRSHPTDLIYINNSRAFAWGTLAAWIARRPVIWHAHNVLVDAKTRLLIRSLVRLPTVRTIICPSDAAAAQFQGLGKVTVIPYGIDLKRFVPSVELYSQARVELGASSNTHVVATIGDLIPLKRQDVFIQAALRILPLFPDSIFLIIGAARPTEKSKSYQSALAAQAHDSAGRIKFLGYRSDIPILLNALDALVVASATETGPLVLLQALASGVPVISTPVGLAARMLADGACGALFPVDDAAALADKLVRLLSDPLRSKQLRKMARQRAVEQADVELFGSRISAAIRQALNSNAYHG